MAEEEELTGSKFIVCFVTLSGKQLTVIGPADAIDMLEDRLRDAADVELHRFDRPQRMPDDGYS
jgi:hypothetical protein